MDCIDGAIDLGKRAWDATSEWLGNTADDISDWFDGDDGQIEDNDFFDFDWHPLSQAVDWLDGDDSEGKKSAKDDDWFGFGNDDGEDNDWFSWGSNDDGEDGDDWFGLSSNDDGEDNDWFGFSNDDKGDG